MAVINSLNRCETTIKKKNPNERFERFACRLRASANSAHLSSQRTGSCLLVLGSNEANLRNPSERQRVLSEAPC